MNFWFYCTEEESIGDPKQYIPFNVEPSKESLAQHAGTDWNDIENRNAVTELYQKARTEMVEAIKQLEIQLFEDDLFVLAKDVPIIRTKLLEMGWRESYWN